MCSEMMHWPSLGKNQWIFSPHIARIVGWLEFNFEEYLMSSTEKSRPPSNIHNDFALDQMDKEEDSRGLIALRDPQEAARLGKITPLPTSFSDGKQRERRPDKAVKSEVLDDDGKVIGERIYLFEFKSEISITALLLQI